MSATDPGPRCPRCRRPLAAWRLEHCVYCGEKFPAELKEGFAAPEGLKWVERPALPTDLAKKMEMMRIVEANKAPKKTRTLTAIVGGLAVPVFVALFYLIYTMMKKLFPGGGLLVIVVGAGVIGYLVAMFLRANRK